MKKNLLIIVFVFFCAPAVAQITDSTQRKVNLQGAVNFRDMGGYATTDGQHVKWGSVYRSADISALTDADLAVLKSRNISYDVDLRGHQEANQQPDRLNANTDYILCPAGSDSLGTWMKSIGKLKGNQGDSLMLDFYSKTQYFTDRYKPFFEKLLVVPAGQSLVFHCTAGKDRTGIAAALFLYALGVPMETIMSDYEATNYYRKADSQKSINAMVGFMHMDKDVANAMMAAKRAYLQGSFDAIIKKYGSVDSFLKNQIGLNDAKIKLLKAKYLN